MHTSLTERNRNDGEVTTGKVVFIRKLLNYSVFWHLVISGYVLEEESFKVRNSRNTGSLLRLLQAIVCIVDSEL